MPPVGETTFKRMADTRKPSKTLIQLKSKLPTRHFSTLFSMLNAESLRDEQMTMLMENYETGTFCLLRGDKQMRDVKKMYHQKFLEWFTEKTCKMQGLCGRKATLNSNSGYVVVPDGALCESRGERPRCP